MADKVADVERAVMLSFELANASRGDSQKMALKVQVAQFLRELESSPEAWKYGIELFLRTTNDYTRFYGLSRLVSALENDEAFAYLTLENRKVIRDTLLGWIQQNMAVLDREKPFILNKVAVLLSLLVKREYPQNWPDAFSFGIKFATANRAGASLFLKLLEGVTQEIVEDPSSRGSSEREVTSSIKDAMRQGPLQEIVTFCKDVMVACWESDPKLVQSCLGILREYAPWIDVQLVVNDTIIPVLYRFVTESRTLRVHALKVFSEIVRKGMDSESKVQLVRSLDLCAVLQRECDKENGKGTPVSKKGEQGNASGSENDVGSVNDGGDDASQSENDDLEEEFWGFRENVAILTCDIGIQLLNARLALLQQQRQQQLPQPPPSAALALEELSVRVIPIVLYECLASSNRDAQVSVRPFLELVIRNVQASGEYELGQNRNSLASKAMLKRSVHGLENKNFVHDVELDRVLRAALAQSLPILLRQMCHPRGLSFEHDNEEEAEFENHRSELRKIYVNIVRGVAIDVVLPFLQTVVSQTLVPSAQHQQGMQIEVTLQFLIGFGEGAPSGVVVPSSRTLLEQAKLGNSAFGKKERQAAAAAAAAAGETGTRKASVEEDSSLESMQQSSSSLGSVVPNDLARAALEDERRAKARSMFGELIATVHRCQLWQRPETRVVLAYHEIAARYVAFLKSDHQELIGAVLTGMAGAGGIKHPDARVRSQACYQLSKVVKGLGTAMEPFANDLFSLLQVFLQVSYESVVSDMIVSEQQRQEEEDALLDDDDDENSSPQPSTAGKLPTLSLPQPPLYSVEDTMCLFEVASSLIALGQPAAVLRQVELVMRPVYTKLEEIITNIPAGKSPEQLRTKQLLGNWAGESVRALGALAKGISRESVTPELAELFKTCLDASLRAADALSDHDLLLSRILSLLHSAIRVLGDASMAFAPRIGVRLLEQSKSMDQMLQAIQFIDQVITTFKERLGPAVDELFSRVVCHIHATLASVRNPYAEANSPALAQPALTSRSIKVASGGEGLGSLTQEQQEYRAVKRAILQFFMCVVESKLDSVMYSPKNSHLLDKIFSLIIDTLSSFPDSLAQTSAAKLLEKLCDLWLVPGESIHMDPNTRTAFARLMLEKASVATFNATSLPSFSPNDQESRELLQAICSFQKSLLKHGGEEWLKYLVEVILPSVGCSTALAIEYAKKLADQELSKKRLAQEFAVLFLPGRK